MLRIRNVVCDYYLDQVNRYSAEKYGSEQKDSVVPIFRIFGIVDGTSQKCCIHVHGFLPYIVLKTKTRLSPVLRQYYSSIIMQIWEREAERKCGPSPLFDIYEERGRSIYGFYDREEWFVRLVFYDPFFAKIVMVILQKQCLNEPFLQPYNAHIPFNLAFFVDFSLSGMGVFELSKCHYRKALSQNLVTTQTSFFLSPLNPSSRVEVELDVFTDYIVVENSEKSCYDYKNAGLDFVWSEEAKRFSLLEKDFSALFPKVEEVPPRDVAGEVKSDKYIFNELSSVIEKLQTQAKFIERSRGDEFCPTRTSPASSELPDFDRLDVDQIDDFEHVPQMDMTPQRDNSSSAAATQLWERHEYEMMGFDVQEDGDDGNQLFDGDIFEDSDGQTNSDFNGEYNQYSATTSSRNISKETSSRVTRYERAELLTTEHSVILAEADDENDGNSLNGEISFSSHQSNERRNEILVDTLILNKANHPLESHSKKGMNVVGAQNSLKQQLLSVTSTINHLSILSLEILALPTQNRAIAEPTNDRILAAFFAINMDACNRGMKVYSKAAIVLKELDDGLVSRQFGTRKILFVPDELTLLAEVGKLVLRVDPDILIGYDVKRFSWGYLFERGSHLHMHIPSIISRINSKEIPKNLHQKSRPPHGRIFVETWWHIRREKPLRSYKFANVVLDVLGKRIPAISDQELSVIMESETSGVRSTILRLQMERACLNIDLLQSMDFFTKNSQMAQIYGIQFADVITRGSQFRVESMLFRLCKRQHFFAPSVSEEQRNRMLFPQTIALNLEPESGIYHDPVAVLDFQSLYPSICIAYNYCFSTCLGRLSNYASLLKRLEGDEIPDDFDLPLMTIGALPYQIESVQRLKELIDSKLVSISPTGGIFVDKSVRLGLLGTMLTKLLDTRVMVKQAMKNYKNIEELTSLLNSRQLALKLIANVTYGYTAANWSGRMPCEEVADAIVSMGRKTLENAIALVNGAPANKYGGARVIYGDTDSLFVLFRGCAKTDAFTLGQQIANDVTQLNPFPVKLKFEKVMQPCVLVTKKRYAGMSYETLDDRMGIFDAKGIEVVRRDSPLLVSKTMKKMLALMFKGTVDAALKYLRSRLLQIERIHPTEFILSTDYRGGYAEGANIPLKKIASALSLTSPRLSPMYGERLSYLVVVTHRQPTALKKSTKNNSKNKRNKITRAGTSPTTLISSIVSVDEFIQNPSYRIDYNYYVNKQLVPALARIFQLVPVRIRWLPIAYDQCLRCCKPKRHPFCPDCLESVDRYKGTLIRQTIGQRIQRDLDMVCRHCFLLPKSIAGRGFRGSQCRNFACPIKGERLALEHDPWAAGLRRMTDSDSQGNVPPADQQDIF